MSIRSLYLCEKPDQAMKVARELGPVDRKDGWVVCKDGAVVTWARGHLYQPMMPEDYSEELKRWNWDTLPIIPKPFKFKPRDDSSKKMIRVINSLLDQAKEVVVATDPDREGELIAYEIIVEKGYKGPIRRANLRDLTPAAIRTALANLEPGEKWYPGYQAALARTCADWVVGMNLSRAATLKLRRAGSGKPLSVGRVQTPTLALMVRLERRIREFKPQDYYELVADVSTKGGHKLKMRFRPAEDRRITDPVKINELKTRATNAQGPLAVTHEDKETAPPALLDLNMLQQQANTRFSWSSDKTLQVAQALYDASNAAKQPLITYPRTDCQVLPEEHMGQITEKVANLMTIPSFGHLKGKLDKPITRPAHYDDSRVTAHTAIVPTLEKPNYAALDNDERKLYELVCRFYLAAHLPNYRFKATKVVLDANGVPFAVGGTVPTFPGWREAFSAFEAAEEEADGGDDDCGALPPVKNGEPARTDKVEVEAKKTKAPERFTEAKLLKAMNNIAAFVDDAAAKKRLKQTSGIGTSATRANIIKTLKDREFIKVEKRKLIPTEAGEGLITALEAAAPDYADPAVTARWEDGLEAIMQRQLSVADFVSAVVEKIKRDVGAIRERKDLGIIGGDAGEERKGPFVSKEARSAIEQSGYEVHVPYGKNEEAKALGLVWVKERTCWMAPANLDKAGLIAKGWLNADGTRPIPQKREGGGGGRRDEILKNGFAVKVPYGKNDEAKAFGAIFDGDRKVWMMPADADRAKLIEMGWLNADGSVPAGNSGGGNGGGKFGGGSSSGSSGNSGGKSFSKPAAGGKGTKLEVPFDRRADVKAIGNVRWNADDKSWYALPGVDLEPFRKAGFLPDKAA